MPYVFISDFKYGMDRRRPRFAGIPGTLWSAKNVHLTRGGDIERRKKFVATYTGLSNTFGMGEINGQPWVFGSANLAGSMPLGVQFQRLQGPSTPNMTDVLDVAKFDSKFYVIAEYDDGNVYHFYNGSRVTTWDTVADGIASAALTYRALALKLGRDAAVRTVPTPTGLILTAVTPGVAFTLAATATNGGAGVNDQTATPATVQANVAAVAEVRASASFTITGGTFDPNVSVVSDVQVNGVSLLPSPVSWSNSDAATALAVALTINEGTDIHGYTAAAVGPTVTVTAIAGSGASANGYVLTAFAGGDVSVTPPNAFSGGVTAVAAVAQVSTVTFGGTFEALDTLTVTLNGVAYKITGRAAATGRSLHVQNNRVFSGAGPVVAYCKLNDPSDWTDPTSITGAGKIVISTDADGAQIVTGLAPYQGYMAVFAETAVVTYSLGANSSNFARIQEVPNAGTVAGRAVVGYGAADVFYLDGSGIRSLQARDASNLAITSDAGSVFDPFVQEVVAAATPLQIESATAIIEPETGAYWLAIGSTILVLTNYPRTEIRGWTYYVAEFQITAMMRLGRRVYLRSSDTIYVYGGISGTQYPAATEVNAEIDIPFVTAKDDAGLKQIVGLDVGASNSWAVTALLDPNDESKTVYMGISTGITYGEGNWEGIGETSHIALRLTCNAAGEAKLSNLAIHHNGKARG
jgi:hypothetical protein